MPEDFVGKQVVCPYYRKMESRQAICCEGDSPLSSTVKQFRHPEQLKRYMALYCKSFNYQNCPHAVLLEQIYSEEGDT